jgi:hypothetical protein
LEKCKIIRGNILALIKYWSTIKGDNVSANLHLIVPPDINYLPLQILEESLRIDLSEEGQGDLSGAGLEMTIVESF